MKLTTSRTCKECGEAIEIKRKDVRDIVYYKNCYYHTSCFRKLAEQRSKSKRGKPEEWKTALDSIEELENCAKDILAASRPSIARDTDPLNNYLLSHYNVQAISNSNFWRTVKELQNGIYKRKKCKKVSLDLLLEVWQWGQRKLDEIDKYNKSHHKGPKSDDERIPYDLAILVTKIPSYLAYKAKQEAAQAEMERNKYVHINYDSMIRTEVKHDEGLDDISALLDEF